MGTFDFARFKNYGLWVSILALIPLLLNAVGVNVVPEQYQLITSSILTILVALGVVSNPTTNAKWFADDTAKVELPAEKPAVEEEK
ncbi:MAG: holin [Clostridium sp.]